MDDETHRASLATLDALFGPGMGARHDRFIGRLKRPELREALHRYHVIEGDESDLSLRENYLLGMTVLCAQGRYVPAGMFARTLCHIGVPEATILAAVARLEMWIGGVPAAEAAAHMQAAVSDYRRNGLDSMKAWFPDG